MNHRRTQHLDILVMSLVLRLEGKGLECNPISYEETYLLEFLPVLLTAMLTNNDDGVGK